MYPEREHKAVIALIHRNGEFSPVSGHAELLLFSRRERNVLR